MFLNTNFISFKKRKNCKPKHNFGYTKPLVVTKNEKYGVYRHISNSDKFNPYICYDLFKI